MHIRFNIKPDAEKGIGENKCVVVDIAQHLVPCDALKNGVIDHNTEAGKYICEQVEAQLGVALDYEKPAVYAPEGKHFCRYCGTLTDSTEAELLCPACRMTQGKMFMYELEAVKSTEDESGNN